MSSEITPASVLELATKAALHASISVKPVKPIGQPAGPGICLS